MVGNNAICYQGIQRVFRNAIVGFLREHMARILPKDHVQQMKKLFGDSWEKAAADATRSREIGGTSTVLRDDYDLLGVNHFFEIFDKYFDKLFSVSGGYPTDRPRPVKSKFLGNFKAIKDGRDPLSHPVEEEIPYDEAFGILTDAKQLLVGLGLENQAAELANLLNSLAGGPCDAPTVLRHLPTQDSIYLEFVGRGDLLVQLSECFQDPDSRRCLLAGDGGKGKSAIAYKFAQQLSQLSKRFQLVIWLSAKLRKFEDGRVVGVASPDFSSATEAVDRLLLEYGAVEGDFAKPLVDRKRLLLEYLDTYPAFIVADDIDSLLNDDDVVSLFSHEIPHTQSAVLLTSRRSIPGIRSFVVKGFDSAEAEQFVHSRARLFGLDVSQVSSASVAEILSVTDGSPLYMDDLMRLSRILGLEKAVKAWADKRGDEARKYALQREMENLSSDAKTVLIAAAIPDGPISFAELESILELSEDRIVSALSELQTLFLFAKPKIVEGEQRFEINLNTKKLVRLVEGQSERFGRIERASKALRGQLPEVGRGIIGDLIRQAQLRLNATRYIEAESIVLDGIQKYPQSADLHSFLGYLYKRIGRIVDARSQFEAAIKLKCKRKDMYLQWIAMELAEKEWFRAIAVADKAIRSFPDFSEMMERKVYTKKQAAFDFYHGFHREKAEKMWCETVEDARSYLRAPAVMRSDERQLSSSMFCSAVISLDMLGKLPECNQWFKEWASEHANDPQVQRQRAFLMQKRKGSFSDPFADIKTA